MFNLPTTKGDKMLNIPTTIPTKLPTNKGEIMSNLTNIASKLPSASKGANLVTVLPEVVKVANGVLDVFKEREKTKQSKITAKIQINESNNQKEIAIAQIKGQENMAKLNYKLSSKQLKNESKEISRGHKKDMGVLGMIQFAIANQASQETIDGLINKL
nr:hypothetical protein [uncultured Campylobacter sp.]